MQTQDVATKLKNHFSHLTENIPAIPEGVSWLLPSGDQPEAVRIFDLFLEKFYADEQPRTLILGINPGRFGAGLTNVSFTDPVHLERDLQIANDLPKREELSAKFIYRVVHTLGGPKAFYHRFFIHSIVPFGFVKNGKNYNYYDEKPLWEAVRPLALVHLRGLLEMGMDSSRCICLGEGQNFRFFSKLNEEEKLFGRIIPLPHPRFVMQYKRKYVDEYIEKYVLALNGEN